MVRERAIWLATLLTIFILPPRAGAQGIGGGIIGHVKDQSGGAVPAALVQLVNTETGQSRAVSSDGEGTFEAREVPPGRYTLLILKGGFNTAKVSGIQLGVSQVVQVGDIVLSVAPVGSETIEVKAAEVGLTETSTPARSLSFDKSQIQGLPLLTRDLNSFALLAPGVASVRSFSFASTLVPFAVNGSPSRDNNFIIDSVDNNEPLFGGAATQFTNTDAFSEYSVITTQYKAEYGRNSGSVVNIITERGGNQWHGSAFWFGQSDALNALNLVEQTAGLSSPAHYRGDFAGATFGGPLRKEKTWAFFSYQWNHVRADLSDLYPQVATIPTVNGLNALSQMGLTSTLAGFLNDPTVRKLSLAGSACTGFISGLPPNGPCTLSGPPNNGIVVNNAPVEFGTYVVPGAGDFPVRDHQLSARLDHRLTPRDDFTGRYLLDDLQSPLTAGSGPLQSGFFDEGLLPSGRDYIAQRTHNAGAFWTHAWPRALHELRGSFSRISSRSGALNLGALGRQNLPAVSVSDNFAQQSGNGGTPQGTRAFLGAFPAAGNLFTFGNDARPTTVQSNLYQVQDNFSVSRGRHSLKFGVNLARTMTDIHNTPSDLGQYFYEGTTNSGFQNFVANVPTVAFQQFANFGGRGGATLPLREFGQSYFAEDDIRLLDHLTVSLGVRYENYGQPINRIADLNPNFATRIHQDNLDFAPRVGFAWSPGQKTVLRGGYGIYYDRQVFNLALLVWQSGAVSPFVTGTPSNVYPQPPFNPGDALRHVTDCDSLSPSSSGPTLSDCTIQDTISPSLVRPLIHSFSIGLQRQLGESWLLEAAYVGNSGTRLFQRIDTNPHTGYTINPSCTPACATYLPRLNPNRDDITVVTNGAHSGYHSLQFSAQKRLGQGRVVRGMVVTAAYVWSHVLDNGSEIFGPDVRLIKNLRLVRQNAEPFEVITPFAQDPNNTTSGERGNSSLDRRHRATLSFVWTLPSPSAGTWTKSLIGGWQWSGIFSVQTGQSFSPLNSFGACADAGGDGNLTNDRPSIGNVKAPLSQIALVADPNCIDLSKGYKDASGNPIDPATAHFVQVPLGARPGTTFSVGTESFVAGNAGRNILTGPGLTDLDLAVSKEFSFHERFRLQFRFEAYDVMNQRNAGSPIGDAFSVATQAAPALAFGSTFPLVTPARATGVIPENSLDALDAATGQPLFLSRRFMNTSSRRMQAAVKLVF
jgi:Carboxypeptidase regulatory-like domain/TonB dependent receptor